MSKSEYRSRSRRRKRREIWEKLPVIFVGLIIIGLVGVGTYKIGMKLTSKEPFGGTAASSTGASKESPPTTEPTVSKDQEIDGLIARADLIAAGYDYDGAIALLMNSELYSGEQRVLDAVAGYEATKSTLVRQDPSKITHVFFHSLVMDNKKAFDGDGDTNGYNQVMTTSGEFSKILQSMYERGFVLVRLRDIAYETTDENGNAKFVAGDIMLPEGKKAFVMSQDDVCYYKYMTGDGFATRMVVGEDGRPACEMTMDDGTVSVGSYDLAPMLDDFVEEHPDFSYKGARAVIAFTGYEGILGYRTAPEYSENPTYEQDKQEAARVAQCLRDSGFELASHSWGHRHMQQVSYEEMVADTDRWEAQVESLIGPTDIILYPFGEDVGDWRPYTSDNHKYQYLHSVGFRYFCNVDSNEYWVQIGDDFMRQGRRNLDGYRIYYDMIETDPEKVKTKDLFNAGEVFDPDRPTPVPAMGG